MKPIYNWFIAREETISKIVVWEIRKLVLVQKIHFPSKFVTWLEMIQTEFYTLVWALNVGAHYQLDSLFEIYLSKWCGVLLSALLSTCLMFKAHYLKFTYQNDVSCCYQLF